MKKMILFVLLAFSMLASAAEIQVPVCWARRSKAGSFQIQESGGFRDGEKYVFALKITDLAKLNASGGNMSIYWNSDGDRKTGRFAGSLGVDVQFNIDLTRHRIAAVLWKDEKEHRYMTLYEDDYLLEFVDNVFYLALRSEALKQFKIQDISDLRINVSDKTKRRDSTEFKIDFDKPGSRRIAPALDFKGFGALKSLRKKKTFAVPVTRQGAASTVWDCGAERFTPNEPTPAFSKATPSFVQKAAKGETTSLFFAVEKAEPFSRLKLTPGVLRDKSGHQIAVSCQSVQYADFVTDDRGGRYTDVLLPEFPGIRTKRQFAVWHVTVPRSAVPGKYKGMLAVELDGRKDVSIPVELSVYNFALPEIPALKSAFSIKQSHIAARFRNRETAQALYWKMIGQCARFRYGPRLPGVDPKFSFKDGKLAIDWKNFDERIGKFFNTCKFNTLQLAAGQLGSHDKFVRWNLILNKKYRDTTDAEFQSVWRQYVRQYADHVKQLGIADKMLFVVWDEPYGLADVIRGAQMVKETAPEIPVGVFIDRCDPALKGKIDIYLVTLQSLAQTLKEAKGQKVWLYNTGGVNNFQLPASDLRSYYWLADRWKIEGFLSSEINTVGKTGGKQGSFYNHYPQHCLLYTSPDGKELYDSWRQVLVRAGMNDYDYLALYRKLLAKHKKDVPSWLLKAEPVFDKAGLPVFSCSTMQELDRLKERVAHEIEKLH